MDAMLGFSVIPDGVSTGHFLLLGALSAFIMGAAKSGFAGSIGMLSTPLLIYACGGATSGSSELALGMMLPMLIACDYVAATHWRGQWDWPVVRLMLPGVILGIAAATLGLWLFLQLGQAQSRTISDAALQLAIGSMALGFVVLQSYRVLRREKKPYRPGSAGGFGVGAAAGFTSMISHAAGPITAMYLLPQQMTKQRYVATATLYYWIGNQLKLLPYLLLGMFTRESLAGSLALTPAVVAGAMMGIFVHHKINQKWFTGVVYVLLTGVGGHLVFKSVRALWL